MFFMIQTFFSYYPDILLCSYIFGGLAMGSFVKHKTFLSDLDELYDKKKNFYLLTRGALFALGLHFFLVVKDAFIYLRDPVYDSLSFFEFYQKVVTNELGTLFFRYDFLTVSFILILNLCTIFYLVLLLNYLANTNKETKYIMEVPILIVTAFFGFKFFLLSYDLILMIICLELASLCTVILLSLQITTANNLFPLEAAVKYFLFNAIGVAFMLIAISGYYIFVQNFNLLDYSLQSVLNPYQQIFSHDSILVLHLFFFVGYLMKLGSAPFHHWVPDVYEGAEFLLTAFLILVASPALNFKFFVFVKLLLPIFEIYHFAFLLFLALGFLSMMVGVINALGQVRLKRFLAYASINHFGFILISLGTPSLLGFFASLFYLLTYIFSNLAFFALILLIQQFNLVTFIYLNQLKSLLNYNYLIFFFFLIPLFSFAGFPPFAGFFGKLFVFASLLDFNKIGLSVAIIIYVVLNAYLYLRFIKIALFEQNQLNFYIPLQYTTKRIVTTYSLTKRLNFGGFTAPFRIKMNFFILFLLNCFLLLFILFLPNFSLFCSQLILNLFIFY